MKDPATEEIMLIGQSPQIITLRRFIRQIAGEEQNVFITGETGTGRKTVAREIHSRSARNKDPFIILNCPALGDTILDSDLFGVTTESKTAVERKLGFLEQAGSGALYLENVDETVSEYQLKLFNVLKEKRFRRLGSETFIPIDFRVYSSASDPHMIKNRSFRRDLLMILNPYTLALPPLRKRKQDIPLLFSAFLKHFCEANGKPVPPVPGEVFESLIEYDWYGNVQELVQTVRNLVLMSPESQLSVEYLPFEIKKHPFDFLENRNLSEAVTEVEMYLIRRALQRFSGNQTRAAHALNVSEAALRYKMKKYGLSKTMFG